MRRKRTSGPLLFMSTRPSNDCSEVKQRLLSRDVKEAEVKAANARLKLVKSEPVTADCRDARLAGATFPAEGPYVMLPAASSSAQPSPSCPASASPSASSSAVASSTIGAAAIIRCSRAASSASVMSDSRFVIASAERCRSRDCAGRPYPRSRSAAAATKRVESVVVLRKFNQCIDRQTRKPTRLYH